jgi:hypothetical protein
MSKYPAFERVTAGKLNVGDVLLVRSQVGDHVAIAGRQGTVENQFRDVEWVPPGLHRITDISASLVRDGYSRKATRTYHLVLRASDDSTVRPVNVSSVLRLNRVVAK